MAIREEWAPTAEATVSPRIRISNGILVTPFILLSPRRVSALHRMPTLVSGGWESGRVFLLAGGGGMVLQPLQVASHCTTIGEEYCGNCVSRRLQSEQTEEDG